MGVTWCKLCDNIPQKRRCRMCKGKGVIRVGHNGIWNGPGKNSRNKTKMKG